jgi:hypothetical protein
VSSLWTPDGERPVARPSSPAGGAPPGAGDDPVDDEALAAEVEAMRAQLAGAPVEEVLANHCYGLFELAAVYLSQQPPLLPQARVAIDALGCLVTGMEGRLGENESALADGLRNLQMAWVQIDGAQRAGASVDAVVGTDAGGGADAPDDAGDAGDG